MSSPGPPEAGEVLIRVKTLEPATYDVHIDKQATVASLKTRLEGLVRGAPAVRQRIIYRGRGLQDESTLQELGVENGDTLHMVLRPPDAPAPAPPAGQGQGQQPAQSRLEADTRRILDQINQMMNLTLGLGPQPGDGGRAQPGQPAPQQPPAPDTPHLLASLHRFLRRLGDPAYTPAHVPLYSNAAPVASMQPEFESLSRALTEVLAGAELPQPLAALRDEAARDPAGRGPPQAQAEHGAAGGAGGEAAQAAAGAASQAAAGGDGQPGLGGPGAAAEGGAGARRTARRRGAPGPGLDVSGTSYGYRYLPLATAALSELLSRTEAHLTGNFAQRLRDVAAGARALAEQQQQQQGGQEAVSAMRRQLRQLSGQLGATAALLADLARAAIATSTALNGMPLSLAANSAAALRPEGDDADLPTLLPRRAGPRGGAAGAGFGGGGIDWGFLGMGPMGAPAAMGMGGSAADGADDLIDVFGAQFTMPLQMNMNMNVQMGVPSEQGRERAAAAAAQGAGEGAAAAGAGGAAAAAGPRPQARTGGGAGGAAGRGGPAGMGGVPLGGGAFQMDITDLVGIPGGLNSIGGLIESLIAANSGDVFQRAGGQGPAPGGVPAAAAGAGAGAAAGGGQAAAPPPQQQQQQESPLNLVMPALTALAGSVAASVMQALAGRGVQPPVLLDALSRALSQHLEHVMNVINSRWDSITRAVERQRRAAERQQRRRRRQQQGQEQQRAATGEQAAEPPATAAAGEPEGGAAATSAAAAAENPLEEFRPVAALINQLFPSWENVLSVRPEPEAAPEAEAEQESSSGEGGTDGSEDGAGAGEGTAGAGEGGERQRRGGADDAESAARRAEREEDMNAILRMLLPPMVANIARSAAHSVVAAVAPEAARTGVLDGQQLAMAVLQALIARLDRVAAMLLSNWARISSGLEQIESGDGASAADMLSQMITLAGSVLGGIGGGGGAPGMGAGAGMLGAMFGGLAQPPTTGRAAPAQQAQQPAAPVPVPRQPEGPQQPAPAAPPPAAAPAAAFTAAPPPQPLAPAAAAAAAAEQRARAAATSASAGDCTGANVDAPASSSAPGTGSAGAAAPEAPRQPDAAAGPSGGESAAGTTSGSGSSPAAGAAAASPSAPAAGPSSAPKGLGLGLRPTAPKKKPAAPAAPPAPASEAAAAAPATAATAPQGSAGPQSQARQLAARPAGGAAAQLGGGGGQAGDPLEAFGDMMERMLGGLDEPGSRGPGGGGGGGGLGGLLQMAQSVVSDPAMQPMIQGMMNTMLGGGGGGGGDGPGGGGGGLGGLLGSLLGGLAPPPPAAAGSSRGGGGAAAPVGYEVLTEVLGPEEGARWRGIIERDVEEIQQHVQAAAEEHSANYRRGVPARRGGLLSAIGGDAGGNGSDEEEDEDEEGEWADGEEGDGSGQDASAG